MITLLPLPIRSKYPARYETEPCPKCGGGAEFDYSPHGGWSLVCRKDIFHLSAKFGKTPQDAVDNWNQKAGVK